MTGAALVATSAADVVGWRTDGGGQYPTATAPATWEGDAPVVWEAKLDWSNAIPIQVADRLFVCEEPTTLVCIDANSGVVLWKKANPLIDTLPAADRTRVEAELERTKGLAKERATLQREWNKARRQMRRQQGADREALKATIEKLKTRIKALEKELAVVDKYGKPKTHKVNGYSTPTPTSDGQTVYVVFGTGVAAAYDLDGARKWIRHVDRPQAGWGHSSSPVLFEKGGTLIVHLKDVIALDTASGAEKWRATSSHSFGSPIGFEIGGVGVVATPAGEVVQVTGDQPGRVLAKGLGKLEYNTPIVQDGVLYYININSHAIRLPATVGGEFETVWKAKIHNDRYYASPLLHEGRIYAVTRNRKLTVLDAANGAEVYVASSIPVERQVYASPTLIGDKVLFSCENGQTVVLTPGDTYQATAGPRIGTFRSCPVALGGRLYLRVYDKLWCLGQ